jgi:hypothetical protein
MTTPLWINEPKILLTNINQFFINNNLSENENKNAIVRFGFYLGCLILLFDQDIHWLLIPLIIILYSLIYNKKTIDTFLNTKINELFETIPLPTQLSTTLPTQLPITLPTQLPITLPTQLPITLPTQLPITLPTQLPITLPNTNCQEPTKDNPFMNYTIGDLIDNPNKKPACKYKDVKDKVKNEFKKNVFTDTYDIWGKNTSDRQFFTMPNTGIVNDQIGFAKWCFGDSGSCKTFGEGCLKYKDPVYHIAQGTNVDDGSNTIDPYNDTTDYNNNALLSS